MLLIIGLIALAAAASEMPSEPSRVFVTSQGIGPDKWASVWLIKRRIDPTATIEFLAVDSTHIRGIPFDIDLPTVAFRRTSSTTTYEKLVEKFKIDDSAVARIGKIVHDVEINRWSMSSISDAELVESAFRELQNRYGRADVPFPCYLEFFDRLYAALKGSTGLPAGPKALTLDRDCETGTERAIGRDALVAELPAEVILARIEAGEKVVFVDAREPDEFTEFHIPNAINLQLREVDAGAAETLADADLVIPYCVKDFRGYEVARAFQKLGLHKVAIMNPYGIKGWRQAGLPVAGKLALSEDDAIQQLALCAKDPATCLKKL